VDARLFGRREIIIFPAVETLTARVLFLLLQLNPWATECRRFGNCRAAERFSIRRSQGKPHFSGLSRNIHRAVRVRCILLDLYEASATAVLHARWTNGLPV
jgi:hypothetical protein